MLTFLCRIAPTFGWIFWVPFVGGRFFQVRKFTGYFQSVVVAGKRSRSLWQRLSNRLTVD